MTSNVERPTSPVPATSTSLVEFLPEDLREPTPRRFATCRHARPEIENCLGTVLLLVIIVVGGFWGDAHGYELARYGLVATVPLFFFFVYTTFNLVHALRLAMGGVPLPATISDGTFRTRHGRLQVWRVSTEVGMVSIQATGPAVPGMVALVLGKQIGVYHPGPLRRGIHTRRIL
ncbi:hypothetical protein WME99_46535 [Sorangium sp. So ce136]|uniref:hypothetical protein n=1 Tax=Sorangium sp. So ce136 TaxID=3133284 RepID=UPI003F0A4837